MAAFQKKYTLQELANKTVLSAWAIVTVECPGVCVVRDIVMGKRLPASGQHQNKSSYWLLTELIKASTHGRVDV